MKRVNNPEIMRGAYEAPRCDMIEIRAERGLCLSGATHDGFWEDDRSGWQN